MAGLRTAGRICFGLALIGFTLAQLLSQDFPKDIAPFAYLPLRLFWVYVTGLVLLTTGFLFVARKSLTLASLVTGSLLLLYFLYTHLPRIIAAPLDPRVLTVAFETLALSCGAFLIGSSAIIPATTLSKSIRFLRTAGLISRYVFAFCLIVFGVQHFLYAEFIQTLMPAWLPGKTIFSYAIRFGFILVALTLLVNVQVRLAMLLLGIMFFSWVAILHAPRAIAQPTVVAEWTSLCIALALSGIGLCLTGGYYKLKDNIFKIKEEVTPNRSALSTSREPSRY